MAFFSGGHNSIEKDLMTSDEIKRLYNAQPQDTHLSNFVKYFIYFEEGDNAKKSPLGLKPRLT